MRSPCYCSKARRPLACKIPPCSCDICTERRKAGQPARPPCGRGDRLQESELQDSMSGDRPRTMMGFFVQAMSIVAFFILATTMFWISVSYYVYQLGAKVYRSGRNTQIAALVLILILLLSLTVSQLLRRCGKAAKQDMGDSVKAAKTPVIETCVTPHKTKTGNRPNIDACWTPDNTQAAEPPSTETCSTSEKTTYVIPADDKDKIQLVPQKSNKIFSGNCSTVHKNITITITDSKAREVFKQSKLFAIPTEMKQPPALLASELNFNWIPFPFSTKTKDTAKT